MTPQTAQLDLRACAFFFDVDGTLAEIAPRPGDARVAPAMLDALQRLTARCPAVAAISGRPIAEIDALLAPLKLPAAGIHGAQRRGPDGRLWQAAGDAVPEIREALAACAQRHPGSLFEDKGVAFALHFRACPDAGADILATAERLVAEHPRFALQPGKCVLEVKPAGIDKGQAIEALLAEAPFAGRRPVFLGDDRTDEAGFAMVNRLEGVSIKIGDEPSAARYRLPDVAAVERWLHTLLAREPERTA